MSGAYCYQPTGKSGTITVEMLNNIYQKTLRLSPELSMILVHPDRWRELEQLKRTFDWFYHFLPRQWFMKERHWSELSKRKQQKCYVRWCWNEAMYVSHLGLEVPDA